MRVPEIVMLIALIAVPPLAYIELIDWMARRKRPRGIPDWPDLRRVKDLKRW
jgi:hypothetical protein